MLQTETLEELPDNLNELSCDQLRNALKKRNLDSKGNKQILIVRLNKHLEELDLPDKGFGIEMNTENPQVLIQKKRRREKSLKINIDALMRDINDLLELPNKQIEIGNRLNDFYVLKENYNDIYNEILDLLSDDEVEPECENFSEYFRGIRQICDKAQNYIAEQTATALLNINSIKASSRSGSLELDRNYTGVKLPKIDLPHFHGDVLKFMAYWDQYKCAVHENNNLSPVQKFTYLRSTLKANALKTIEGFEVTAANYDHAVVAILHRFGRRRIIVSSLVKSIIKIEQSEMVNATSLRDLHDTLQNRIRALEGLGFKPEHNAQVQMLLIPLLEMKLPKFLAEMWELEVSEIIDENITIDRFFKFLNRQVVSKEAGERSADNSCNSVSSMLGSNYNSHMSNRKGNRNRPSNAGKRNNPIVSSAQAFVAGTKQQQDPSCGFCGKKGHESANCFTFKNRTVDERWNIAKDKRLCFNCLKSTNSFHNSGNCRKASCTIEGCGKKHHRLLHQNFSKEVLASPERSQTTISGYVSSNRSVTQSLLQTALATLVVDKNQEIPVRVLLDPGSQRSYIRKQIAESVGLRGPTEVLSVSTLGGETSRTKKMQRVQFSLTGSKIAVKSIPIEIEALTIDKVCINLDPVEVDLSKYHHLQNLEFADCYPRGPAQVDILIGADYYYSIVDGICKRGPLVNSPTAVGSCLGWILCGPIENYCCTTTSAMLTTLPVDQISASLKRFWELESIGITDDQHAKFSSDDESALCQFNQSLKFDGERYEVALPWKENHPELKDNYIEAVKRLTSVENQLRRNDTRAVTYSEAINQYVKDGYAEEVKLNANEQVSAANVRYLPHHAVLREDKATTKTRIVFDASQSKTGEASLNDCVLPGPALQPNLISVLLRFRCHPIAIMSDVKKMFLQIKLASKDQDVHRYLWRDMKIEKPPVVYKMKRLTFGVNSSPFLANGTVQHHAKKYEDKFPDASQKVLSDMYVDDILTGTEDDKKALKLQQSLATMMKEGGFILTKWASNSEYVMSHIEEKNRASTTTIDFDQTNSLKALGMSWNIAEDFFFFALSNKVLNSNDPETKRSLLSLASKVFDPMGLLSPFIIRAKILFQELWSRGLQWDDKLPEDILENWRSWKAELVHLNQIHIPRYFAIGLSASSSIEIHGFGDASPKAYGSSVYARIEDVCGGIRTQLLISKSRVAPLKKVTLPRLELLAAVVNARLLRFVVDALNMKINQILCWTDSSITLYWIQRPSAPWKPFVANRVQEIQSIWDPSLWRHCPGESNPSDCVTRGMTIPALNQSELWWNGPNWLKMSQDSWPVNLSPVISRLKAQEEVKKIVQVHIAVNEDPVIDPSRYSSWSKLIHITAYVILFVIKMKEIGRRRKESLLNKQSNRKEVVFTTEDIINSEYFWYRKIQKEAYQDEFGRLQDGQPISKTSRILKLDPFYDKNNQILRVGGRLHYSDFPEETKHQVILPHGNPIVDKIIQETHKRVMHAGPETTLTILREKIWLTQARRDIKRVISKCLVCQRQRVGPCAQKMAPLPPERVCHAHAFSHVGVDFAGPLYAKTKTEPTKVYICIFTCASSRMLHLELTHNMSTDEFLQAFHRMINRRGLCNTVWSDNAQTFKAASRGIKQLFNSSSAESRKTWKKIDEVKLKSDLASRGIKWRFNAELSPWRGGWWERFCRSVKEPLRKVLGKALLTYTELYTVLTDVESIINSRPLTFVGDDIRDAEPITPAHLAIGRSLKSLPTPTEAFPDDSHLLQRYLYRQRLVNHFWGRWSAEYLHQLTTIPKWNQEEPPLKVGDVVLVSVEKIPRGKWPLARVVQVYPGKDNLVRTVLLQTAKGQLRRPIQRLHKLELSQYGDNIPTIIKSDIVLSKGDQCGEDVQARTRSGRICKPVDRLGWV